MVDEDREVLLSFPPPSTGPSLRWSLVDALHDARCGDRLRRVAAAAGELFGAGGVSRYMQRVGRDDGSWQQLPAPLFVGRKDVGGCTRFHRVACR